MLLVSLPVNSRLLVVWGETKVTCVFSKVWEAVSTPNPCIVQELTVHVNGKQDLNALAGQQNG